MFNLNLYEIKALDWTGQWYEYYYCLCRSTLDSVQMAKTNAIPDKCRLVMDDRDAMPVEVNRISLIKYIYRKYFKKGHKFHFGYKVNWEKEKI